MVSKTLRDRARILMMHARRGGNMSYKFLGTCDTCENITTEHVIDSSQKCLRGLKVIKELGRGDVGVAYELESGTQLQNISNALNSSGQYVLKEVLVQNAKELKQLTEEICIGRYLGELGIAPRIYSCWVCVSAGNGNNTKATTTKKQQFPVKGYYVMDKIEHIWEKLYPSNSEKTKHTKAAPAALEEKLVDVLATMVKAGIIHQDCHPGNIGILKDGRPVIFDFGFSIRVSDQITLPEVILMSQLYIVIEQYDKSIMYDSKIYDTIYEIRQGKYRIR